MILVLCSAGHVAVAAREAADSIHEPAVFGDPLVLRDPFKLARGCRAIVYAPAPRLLDADAGGIATTRGIREVVRAAHAPGIERVVVIASTASFGKEDERVLAEDGVPFAIVRCAALLDELADAANLHTARSVWLPRGRVVELATRCALAATIRSALFRDDLCGSTIAVPALELDLVEAMRRAAAIAGARVKVHGALPGLSSAMRRVHAWTHRRASLDVEVLCDRLSFVGSRSPSRRQSAAAAAVQQG